MITHLHYIGSTDSGHYTNGNLYIVLGFSQDGGNTYSIVLNDSGIPEATAVTNWPEVWEIATVEVPGLRQVYPA